MNVCLIVIGNLCLNGSLSVTTVDDSMHTSVRVSAPEYSMSAMLATDNIRTPDWIRMSRACEGAACISYFKHCEQGKERASCVYHFSQPGDLQNTELTIVARDLDGLRTAEQTSGVMARSESSFTRIPLNRLTEESKSTTPPYCDRHKPATACMPAESGDPAAR